MGRYAIGAFQRLNGLPASQLSSIGVQSSVRLASKKRRVSSPPMTAMLPLAETGDGLPRAGSVQITFRGPAPSPSSLLDDFASSVCRYPLRFSSVDLRCLDETVRGETKRNRWILLSGRSKDR